jgi:hypothetical protein
MYCCVRKQQRTNLGLVRLISHFRRKIIVKDETLIMNTSSEDDDSWDTQSSRNKRYSFYTRHILKIYVLRPISWKRAH